MSTFGFILTRCMRNEETAVYWIECIQCIRRWYPAPIPIVVIDDGSLPKYLVRPTSPVQPWMTHVRIETVPEFPGRGELLPYYYLCHQKSDDEVGKETWETAIIIHDSLFLQAPLPIDPLSVATFCPLFEFYHTWDKDPYATALISHIPDPDHRNTLLRTYHAKQTWQGCFGMMSVVRRQFIVALQDKYDLFALMPHIRIREDRCQMERILAVAVQAFAEAHRIAGGSSVYGNIHDYTYGRNMYWYFTWTDYQRRVSEESSRISKGMPNLAVPVIKVWSGR